MTIIDDLKAINKDIAKAKNKKWQVIRTKYWITRLTNVYPDYDFFGVTDTMTEDYIIIYRVKESVL